MACSQAEVGAGYAEDDSQQSEPPAVAAVSIRRVALVAPVAVRVRRSPTVSPRIRPTVIASTPRVKSMPIATVAERNVVKPPWLSRDSIVKPESAATSRASASCREVSGSLDSISQRPDGPTTQPRWRMPSGVIKDPGRDV